MTRPDESNFVRKPSDRRTFLRKGVATAGAVGVGAALLSNGPLAFAEEGSGRLTTGDAAIRRFLAAADILETDLWQQYTNLGALAQPVVHLSFDFFIFFWPED